MAATKSTEGTWCVRVYHHQGKWTEEPHDSPTQAAAAVSAALKQAGVRRIDLVLIEGEGDYVPQEQQYLPGEGDE